MGLVNCLNQLGLHIICVQDTWSPLTSTLPMTNPFATKLPVGTQGRAHCFPLHSSVDCVSRLKDCRSTVHPLATGAMCVCSFYAPHAGIAISARVLFWRSCGLCTSCHAVPLPFVPGQATPRPGFRASNFHLWPIVEEMSVPKAGAPQPFGLPNPLVCPANHPHVKFPYLSRLQAKQPPLPPLGTSTVASEMPLLVPPTQKTNSEYHRFQNLTSGMVWG